MKKITVLSVIICMVLSGCGVRMSMADENTDMKSSIGIFDVHTSYFNHYSLDQNQNSCKVKGTLHQAAEDYDSVIAYITAKEGGGSVRVTGSMECTRGNLRLVYKAPDGTETLIAEDADRKIDVQVDAVEGEGTVGFASDGESAVCDFKIKMKAGDGVTFASIMGRDSTESEESAEASESDESVQDAEELEAVEDDPENREASESVDNTESLGMPDLAHVGLDEIENNWPESIRYHSNGCSANPMSVRFDVDAPVTVSVTCLTLDGKLRCQIVRNGVLGEIGETVYFDETNPDGEYTVELDKKGQYKMRFYAKEHVGSVEIMPVEE